MAMICLDYGHGGTDSGAVYRGRKEKDDNLQIGRAVANDLRKYGLVVDEIRKEDKSLSLKERSDFERRKDYDFFISFHRNAFQAEKARGVETYIYPDSGKKSRNLASNIQKELILLGFKDRGVKAANFHVLRETRSPAVLIELGFIDSTFDNQLIEKRKDKIIKAISKAILKSLNISIEKN